MAKAASWVFIIASGPYQHGLNSDPAIDILMAAGAFGQHASVLFMGDGLRYLDSRTLPIDGLSDLRKLLKSLPLYDVDDVYCLAVGDAVDNEHFIIPVEIISADRASQLFARADHIVSF